MVTLSCHTLRHLQGYGQDGEMMDEDDNDDVTKQVGDERTPPPQKRHTIQPSQSTPDQPLQSTPDFKTTGIAATVAVVPAVPGSVVAGGSGAAKQEKGPPQRSARLAGDKGRGMCIEGEGEVHGAEGVTDEQGSRDAMGSPEDEEGEAGGGGGQEPSLGSKSSGFKSINKGASRGYPAISSRPQQVQQQQVQQQVQQQQQYEESQKDRAGKRRQ
jgi:hypothetical protein